MLGKITPNKEKIAVATVISIIQDSRGGGNVMTTSKIIHKNESLSKVISIMTYTVGYVWAQFLIYTFNKLPPATSTKQISHTVHQRRNK